MKTLVYAFAALVALGGVAWGQACAHEDHAEGELGRMGYRVLAEGVDGNGVAFRLYAKHNGEWVIVYQPSPGVWCIGNAGPSIRTTEKGA